MEINNEVLYVAFLMRENPGVGSATIKLIKDTIRKYPGSFPEIIKYNNLSQEIHDAYDKEWDKIRFIDKDLIKKQNNSKGGIWKQLQDSTINISPKEFTLDTLKVMLNNLAIQKDEEEKEKLKQQELEKQIWNKHYLKHGIPWSENLRVIKL